MTSEKRRTTRRTQLLSSEKCSEVTSNSNSEEIITLSRYLTAVWLMACLVGARARATSSSPVQRVCIIGAGAAGLAALQVFKNEYGFSHVTCYEKRNSVGGAWAYATEDNPMYDSLRTNLPKEVMAFSKNFPFRSDLPSFVHRSDVLDYLTTFAAISNLNEHIHLSTTVTSVVYDYHDEMNKYAWKITYQENLTKAYQWEWFDALIVANGHFNLPNFPEIRGQYNFKGTVSHSYYYKNPEQLLQVGAKKILVVGGKSSGTDIARELAEALYSASKRNNGIEIPENVVYISVRGANPVDFDECGPTDRQQEPYVSLLQYLPGMSHIDNDGRIVFTNNETLENVDHILMCTGYSYYFPFFKEKTGSCDNYKDEGAARVYDHVSRKPTSIITVTDRSVRRLYQHLIYNENPTLSFLGLPHTVVPFPLFYLQARYLGSVYSSAQFNGRDSNDLHFPSLPSYLERENWVDKHEYRVYDEKCSSQATGSDDKMYHNLGGYMWSYFNYLQEKSNSDDFISVHYLTKIKEIYDAVSSSRPKKVGYPATYREDTYDFDRESYEWKVH